MIMRKPFHIPVSGRDSLEGHSRGMSVRDENPASSRQLLLGAACHKDLGLDGLIDCCHPAPRLWPSLTRPCSILLSAQHSGKGILTALPGCCLDYASISGNPLSHHSEQPWHSWGSAAGARGHKQRLVCQEPGVQMGEENQLGKEPWS